MDKLQVRWGILGTGGIAAAFAEDLNRLPDHLVAAVGSRTLKQARSFAQDHGIPRAHGSYEELVADPRVDVVYVATPHPFHHPNAMLALGAGKPVLVEKPLALDGAQGREMVEEARRRGLFLMEALVTRFLPHWAEVQRILAAGTLGVIGRFEAHRGESVAYEPAHRLFNPALGGGVLWDLGIYPLSLASLVLGTPETVTVQAAWAPSGVEDQVSVDLGYGSGARGWVTASFRTADRNGLVIAGSRGILEVPGRFSGPATVTVRDPASEKILSEFKNFYEGPGLRAGAAEAGRCLRAGLTESPLMPLDESVSILGTLDRIRAGFRR